MKHDKLKGQTEFQGNAIVSMAEGPVYYHIISSQFAYYKAKYFIALQTDNTHMHYIVLYSIHCSRRVNELQTGAGKQEPVAECLHNYFHIRAR